jgi:nucleotide-binding universal stress UspA family protein
VLSASPRALPARDELARLHVAEEYWPLVELHQAPAFPEDSIMAAIIEHGVELVVMSARGAAAEEPTGLAIDMPKILGHVTQAVIERSPVPVLLLPPAYREALPWARALVPVSGGGESDDALVLAVRLAVAIDLTVHVAHVAVPAENDALAAQARYSDALHHEYRDRLEELVARAIPALTRDDCRRIRSTALGTGDVGDELLRRMELDRISLLVAGWHGRFATGHARILKQLIPTVQTPVLLVRSVARPRFRLDVGEAFE